MVSHHSKDISLSITIFDGQDKCDVHIRKEFEKPSKLENKG
jgi:hypothetical protein